MKATLFRDDAIRRLKEFPDGMVDMVLTDVPVAIDVRERPSVYHFPSIEWVREALRVSRGPVVYTMGPDSFLRWIQRWGHVPSMVPDQVMVWLIERPERFTTGQRSMGADFNLVCVHRPGRKLAMSSDVILAAPGYHPTAWKWRHLDVAAHPAPGSFELATKLVQIWGARSVLDPFCGAGVTLEGARFAGADEVYGVEIDADYIASAARYFEQVADPFSCLESDADMSLAVGRA